MSPKQTHGNNNNNPMSRDLFCIFLPCFGHRALCGVASGVEMVFCGRFTCTLSAVCIQYVFTAQKQHGLILLSHMFY